MSVDEIIKKIKESNMDEILKVFIIKSFLNGTLSEENVKVLLEE